VASVRRRFDGSCSALKYFEGVKKIVCPRCGTINLEKFVTFPNCAGCNALLPSAKDVPHDPFWRRRVSGWIWAGLLGGAGLGVLAGVVFYFQASSAEFGQLLVYGQAPRRVTLQQTFTCQLTLDTLSASKALSSRHLRNVRLRLPHKMDGAFDVFSVAPPPDDVTISGIGRYYHFENLPLDSIIKISLRSRLLGRQRLAITIHADAHLSARYQTTIDVQKPKTTPLKVKLSPQARSSSTH
jgi:hypothetical protein